MSVKLNFKSILNEEFMSRGWAPPKYHTRNVDGEMWSSIIGHEGIGEGANKQDAEQDVAELVYHTLGAENQYKSGHVIGSNEFGTTIHISETNVKKGDKLTILV